MTAAGGSKILPKIDGIDQWKSLVNNKPSARSEILYNIDPGCDLTRSWVNGGIRMHDMKLLLGNPGKPDGWIPPPSVVEVVNENEEIEALNNLFASYDCSVPHVQLYNLTADPYEKINIAAQHPKIVQELTQKLQAYGATMIPPDNAPEIEDGNPNKHGGVYGPGWCTAQPS